MPRKSTSLRCAVVFAGVSALTFSLGVPSASADEVYLGKRNGYVDVTHGPKKWDFTDKQYRSTSLPNLRKHSIRITYKGCAEWKARASVK